MSRRLARIQELERLGTRVLPARADVSDSTQLRAVIDQARAEFGPLHGVIHAAGATESDAFGPIKEMTVNACERHFKTEGRRSACTRRRSRGRAARFLRARLFTVRAARRPRVCRLRRANAFMDSYAARTAHGRACTG